MLIVKSFHTTACFNAWINCESLLTDIQAIKKFLSKKIVKVLDECAYICMGTFHALKTGSVNSRNMVLLCVGICEECAEVCEMHKGSTFEECARICRECSNRLSDLTLAA